MLDRKALTGEVGAKEPKRLMDRSTKQGKVRPRVFRVFRD